MPNNFYNFLFKKALKEEEDKLLSQSCVLARTGIKEFLEGKIKTYPKKSINEKIIDGIYHMVYPYYANFITRKIIIDTDKCIHCKLCEKMY